MLSLYKMRFRKYSIILLLSSALALFPLKMSLAGKTATNRLIHEKSPYLLKHATNPIDWFPWGEEAFARARRENKPIFLSIGYSTCHWCNVMEEESFSNPEVAALMNEVFVSIKVDREERPDIDQIYMTVCQMVSTACDWPLTVFMTQEKKPFFIGTYFPKEDRFGHPGMLTLIKKMKKLWAEERQEIIRSAQATTEALADISSHTSGKKLDKSSLTAAYQELVSSFDHEHGGFGSETKFPKPHNLMFLLRYWKRTGKADALTMVEKTLNAMRHGGIYDQLGFGFHRYSTDPTWRVPHFEKMLYDQALLAIIYTETYQATGKEQYARTVRQIFKYVMEVMTSTNGCFYSAESADSEGEEGEFYLWRAQEINDLLDAVNAEKAQKLFHVAPGGNFIDPLTGQKTGANILYLKTGIDTPDDLESIRTRLHKARSNRPRPDRDDKVLTDWNGLMIAALARAGRALDEPVYAKAAARAADFIINRMRDSKGRLLHRWRDGQAGLQATSSDYAFLIWGLIELYEWDFDTKRLETALMLTHECIKNFWDDKQGGFFFTAHHSEPLPVRMKDIDDRAIPSSNSVAMLNLLRLGRLTGNADFEVKAAKIAEAFSETITKSPADYTMFMTALDFGEGPSHEVVVVGKQGAEDTKTMLTALGRNFLPETVVLFKPAGQENPPILRYADFVKYMTAIDGRATAYVCTNFNCEFPTSNVDAMLGILRRKTGR